MQGRSSEFKLQTHGLFVSIGLFLIFTALPFNNWFYLGDVGFSILAQNSTEPADLLGHQDMCKTYFSVSTGFICLCEKDYCEILRQLHLVGYSFIACLVLSLNAYIIAYLNTKRKLWNLTGARSTRSWLDYDVLHLIGPLFILLAFSLWVILLTTSGTESEPNLWISSDFSTGPSFKNAILGSSVLVWAVCYYFMIARRDYLLDVGTS